MNHSTIYLKNNTNVEGDRGLMYKLNNGLKILNILVFIVGLIIIGVYHNNVPLKIKFGQDVSAKFSVYADFGSGFISEPTVYNINKSSKKIFLTPSTKNVALKIETVKPYYIEYIKIGKFEVQPIFTKIKINGRSAHVVNDFPQLLKERQHKINNVFFIFILSCLALILLEYFSIWAIKNKELHNRIKTYSYYCRDLYEKLIQSPILTYLLLILIFLFSVNFITYVNPYDGVGLDNSWQIALNKLNIQNQYLFGRDVVFTYGPLGFLFCPLVYGNNLQIAMYAILLKWLIFLGIIWFNVFKINKNYFTGKIFLLIIGSLFLFSPGVDWNWMLVYLLLILTLWFCDNESKLNVGLLSVLIGFFTSTIFFIKFNSSILALVLSILLLVSMYIYERKYFLTLILSFTASSLVTFICLYSLYIKNLSNLVGFIKGSLSMAESFNFSMSLIGPWQFTLLAIIIMALYVLLLVKFFKSDLKLFIGSLFLAPFIFFSFKHGFIRQDAHMLTYFETIPYAIGFLGFYVKKDQIKSFISIFIAILILSNIYIVSENTTKVFYPRFEQFFNLKETQAAVLNSRNERFETRVLPQNWVKVIGDNSIQILPWEISYAAANNLTGWQPNPSLQLYQAGTEYLDGLSAKSFASSNAPEYILTELDAIDGRIMTLDCPSTWITIMDNYYVLLSDKDRLLLKKKPQNSEHNFKYSGSQSCKFNETVVIPDTNEYLYSRVEIKLNLLGKILALLFKVYPAGVEIKFANGLIVKNRIIPNTLKNHALINYIPENINYLSKIIDKRPSNNSKVVSIKFINNSPLLYDNKIKIEWFK